MGKYCYVASARRRATGEERGGGILCRHAHSLVLVSFNMNKRTNSIYYALINSNQNITMQAQKITFSTNLFDHSLLASIWIAFSDYILDRTYSAQRFLFFFQLFFFLFILVVR